MDAEDVHELQLRMLGDEVLEIRLVLEEVRVDFLVVRRKVRLYIVIELDDLKLDAFLFELRLNDFENLGVGDGGGADLDDLLGLAAIRTATAADEGKRHKCEHEGE